MNPEDLAAADATASASPQQAPGTACEICEDNWVEVGGADDTNGQPLAGLSYRVCDAASRVVLAQGVLDDEGLSPRHPIPVPYTDLVVIVGTEAAVSDAISQMPQTAPPGWRGFDAGLSRDDFNAQHWQRIQNGDFVDEDRSFLEGAGSGARGLGNLAWSLVSGQGIEGWAQSEYERRRDDAWEQYQLATGARTASGGESFGAGAEQGLTFGFGDEIAAGLGSLFDDRSYEELIQAQRQTMDLRREANPGYFIAGEVAGAVPTIFVPVGAAANSARGAGMTSAMASGARTGAVAGAASGAGHDEGSVIDRLDGAALGAATGGLAGGVLSGLGVLVARGVSKTRIWARLTGRSSQPARHSYNSLMRQVDELDVSTPRDQSVFYSGRGAREAAEDYAGRNGMTTLESTPGGRWLDDLRLFDGTVDDIDPSRAAEIWGRTSANYAQGASGNVTAVINNPRASSIFLTQELPALLQNPNVTGVTVRSMGGQSVVIPPRTTIDRALGMIEGF